MAQRAERERVHLLYNIVVTAPVSHLDTSELNTEAYQTTTREGATKKKKDQPHHKQQKVPFSNTQNKQNKTCERHGHREREREYTYSIA